MSVDNVTPIKGNGSSVKSAGEPPSGKKSPEDPQIGLRFRDVDDEPGSLRVFQALRAVCSAAEDAGVAGRDQEFVGLGTAADILSEMLENRMELGG